MLIVVMMGKWSDDSEVVQCVDAVVISGDDVCCSVVFGLSARMLVKLCTLGVFALGLSLVS